MTCSPSPITKASTNEYIGSGLNVACPPAIISGCVSSRSLLYIGIPAKSNAFNTLVYNVSYGSENQTILNLDKGCLDSREYRGIQARRMPACISAWFLNCGEYSFKFGLDFSWGYHH